MVFVVMNSFNAERGAWLSLETRLVAERPDYGFDRFYGTMCCTGTIIIHYIINCFHLKVRSFGGPVCAAG